MFQYNDITIEEPIVIIGLPRSGTSMVAGIFAEHGVFIGECKAANEQINARGFYEHIGFTELLTNYYGRGLVSRGEEVEPMPGFREEILELMVRDGYKGGPWLIKHATVYHKIWEEFNPRFILVRRNSDSILQSTKSVRWKSNINVVRKGQEVLDRYSDCRCGVEVSSEKIIQGDYEELHNAFAHCGLVLDEKIVKEFVDPSLWRFKEELEQSEQDTTEEYKDKHGIVVMRDKANMSLNYKKGQKHV